MNNKSHSDYTMLIMNEEHNMHTISELWECWRILVLFPVARFVSICKAFFVVPHYVLEEAVQESQHSCGYI
jgi:hypothetical protein